MAIVAFLVCSVVLHVAWAHSDICPTRSVSAKVKFLILALHSHEPIFVCIYLCYMQASGASYRFNISIPAGCTHPSSCTFFAALRTNDNSSEWLDYYMEGAATGYLALGWNSVSQTVITNMWCCTAIRAVWYKLCHRRSFTLRQCICWANLFSFVPEQSSLQKHYT